MSKHDAFNNDEKHPRHLVVSAAPQKSSIFLINLLSRQLAKYTLYLSDDGYTHAFTKTVQKSRGQSTKLVHHFR